MINKELILEQFDKRFFSLDGNPLQGGLCIFLIRICQAELVTLKQWNRMTQLLEEFKPKDSSDMYWWPWTHEGNARRREVLIEIIDKINSQDGK